MAKVRVERWVTQKVTEEIEIPDDVLKLDKKNGKFIKSFTDSDVEIETVCDLAYKLNCDWEEICCIEDVQTDSVMYEYP